MRVLYYDCYIGISGDMNLGALIDVGVDSVFLIDELAKLHLESEYKIDVKKSEKRGISGTKVNVVLLQKEHPIHQGKPDDLHEREDRDISHLKKQRNIRDIECIINSSGLSQKIKDSSLRMFMRIARAEANVHGKTIEEVHFHEVGATDSIIDIVGAAIALDYLKVDKIISSPVQVGGGFIKCAHGLLPVPAPATAVLLSGVPTKFGLVPFEVTTPTGAAILAENVDEYTDKLEMVVEKIGYGIGNMDLEIPNMLRVYLGNSDDSAVKEIQYVIETNIDDMSPEIFSYVEERLFEEGALDVYSVPIIMKKGRPAAKLSVLVDKNSEDKILSVIFNETTSIGVRKTTVEKIMLHRETNLLMTKYGEVSLKTAFFDGRRIKYKPEFEDCRRIAREENIPIMQVYKEIEKETGRLTANENN